MTRLLRLTAAAALAALLIVSPASAETADAGPPFGRLELVQEIDCAAVGPASADAKAAGDCAAAPAAALECREYPEGISRVETVLGRRAPPA